jgi:spore maturation protein CgeB
LKKPRLSFDTGRKELAARLNENHLLEVDSQIDTERLLSPPRSLLVGATPKSNRTKLKIVILGSAVMGSDSCDSANVYRGLTRELSARGHHVLLLERESTGGAGGGDLPKPVGGRVEGYSSLQVLKDRFTAEVREADFVIVGSNLGEGVALGEWVTHTAQGAAAFYDLDLPATMTGLAHGRVQGISDALIRRYDLYLSTTGGVLLDYFEKHHKAPMVRPLYASVDAMLFFPERQEVKWDLGYLGCYDANRQPALERLLVEPARRWEEGRFVVAGSQYPRSMRWPKNIKRLASMPAARQRAFYNSQRFALNLTAPGALAAGFSPAAQLFEAAACGVPIITEFWSGLATFFKPDEEILISHSPDETLVYLEEISELDRRRVAYRARERVLAKHTTRHRAAELECYAFEVLKRAKAAA